MEVEPELFKYDFQVNQRELLGYHKDHEIPEARLSELARHIQNFYLRYKSKQFPPGTLQDLLIEFLESYDIQLTEEEKYSDDFNRLLLTQPDGPPPVQDNDLPPDKQAFQEHLEKEKGKIINRLKENGYLLTEERSETYNSDESYVSETESKAESERGKPMETWNKKYDNFAHETFAIEEKDSVAPSQTNLKEWDMREVEKENYEPPMDLNDEDLNFLTQSPDGNNKGDERFKLPDWSTLISQRPRANFIATPLGWSLLEIPSCS